MAHQKLQYFDGHIYRILNDGTNGQDWQALGFSKDKVWSYLSSAHPLALKEGDDLIQMGTVSAPETIEPVLQHIQILPTKAPAQRLAKLLAQDAPIAAFGADYFSEDQTNTPQRPSQILKASQQCAQQQKPPQHQPDGKIISWLHQLAQTLTASPIYVLNPEQFGYSTQATEANQARLAAPLLDALPKGYELTAKPEDQKAWFYRIQTQAFPFNLHTKPILQRFKTDFSDGINLVLPYYPSTSAKSSLSRMAVAKTPIYSDLPYSAFASQAIPAAHELAHALLYQNKNKPGYTRFYGTHYQECFADSFALLAYVRDYQDFDSAQTFAAARHVSQLFGDMEHQTYPACADTLRLIQQLNQDGTLQNLSTQQLFEHAFDIASKNGKSPNQIDTLKVSSVCLWTSMGLRFDTNSYTLSFGCDENFVEKLKQIDVAALEKQHNLSEGHLSDALECLQKFGKMSPYIAPYQLQQSRLQDYLDLWDHKDRTPEAAIKIYNSANANLEIYEIEDQAYDAECRALEDFAEKSGLDALQQAAKHQQAHKVDYLPPERPELGIVNVISSSRASVKNDFYTEFGALNQADRVNRFVLALDKEADLRQKLDLENLKDIPEKDRLKLIHLANQRVQAAQLIYAHPDNKNLAKQLLNKDDFDLLQESALCRSHGAIMRPFIETVHFFVNLHTESRTVEQQQNLAQLFARRTKSPTAPNRHVNLAKKL